MQGMGCGELGKNTLYLILFMCDGEVVTPVSFQLRTVSTSRAVFRASYGLHDTSRTIYIYI